MLPKVSLLRTVVVGCRHRWNTVIFKTVHDKILHKTWSISIKKQNWSQSIFSFSDIIAIIISSYYPPPSPHFSPKTAPVCSVQMVFVDINTQEHVRLDLEDISIHKNTLNFTSERLTLNRRYGVMITATNFNGLVVSNIDELSECVLFIM